MTPVLKRKGMNFASLDTIGRHAGHIGKIMFALFKPPSRHVNRGNVVYAPRGAPATTCARDIIILSAVVYVNIYNSLISSARRREA